MSIFADRKKRKRPELPLVPLIDVLVMLVLFSYVTMQAREKRNTTLNITLPKVETAGKNEFSGSLTISIDNTGQLSFSTGPSNNHPIKDEELKPLLTEVKDKAGRDVPVLIKADETTQLKKLAFVMDTCRSLGLNQFALESR